MTVLYTTGANRIVYKAESFGASKTVTAYFWNPSLEKSSLQTFTEIELGLYYLDYDFEESVRDWLTKVENPWELKVCY